MSIGVCHMVLQLPAYGYWLLRIARAMVDNSEPSSRLIHAQWERSRNWASIRLRDALRAFISRYLGCAEMYTGMY